jgi:hypothetical protein
MPVDATPYSLQLMIGNTSLAGKLSLVTKYFSQRHKLIKEKINENTKMKLLFELVSIKLNIAPK